MSKLPVLSGEKCIKALAKAGSISKGRKAATWYRGETNHFAN